MWNDSLYQVPQASFKWPVTPPSSGPGDGPCVCVSFNEEWVPLILGSLQQLAQDSTWRLGPGDDIQVVQGRVNQLMEMFGASNQCGPGPAPVPPDVNPDDFDCGLAGYLVNEVVRQGMQSAIDLATGVGGPQAILFHLLDFVPFGGDIVAGFGNAVTDVAATIGLNTVFNWAQAQAEQALWDAVGCTVYSIVTGVHGFTADTWTTLLSELRNFGGPSQPFFSAVADLLDNWGIGNANAIAELAGSTHYDCTGCGSGGGPTTTNPPVANKLGLTVSDGTTTVHNVTDINVTGGTVGGTPDDSTLTIDVSPPVPLTVTDGVNSVDNVASLRFMCGSVSGTSPDAVYTCPAELDANGTVVVVSSPIAKAKTLWNGSGNDSAPANWYELSYDDSAWAHAVYGAGGSPGGIWPEAPGVANPEDALFRQHFTLPAGRPTSAQLNYECISSEGVYINGLLVVGSVGNDSPGVVALDVSSLNPDGADNVIAMKGTGHTTTPRNYNTYYGITVSGTLTGATGATGPQGPQGPQGDTGPQGLSGPPGGLVAQVFITKQTADWDPITNASGWTDTPHLSAISITVQASSWLRVGLSGAIRAQDSITGAFGVTIDGGSTTQFVCACEADIRVPVAGFIYFEGLEADTYTVQVRYIGLGGDSIRSASLPNLEGLSFEVWELRQS